MIDIYGESNSTKKSKKKSKPKIVFKKVKKDEQEPLSLLDNGGVDIPYNPYLKNEFTKTNDKDVEILNKMISLTQSSFNDGEESDSTSRKKQKKLEKKERKRLEKERKAEKKKKKKEQANRVNLNELNIFDKNEQKKMSTDKDIYVERFGGSLELLKDLLTQVNGTLDESKEYLDQLKNNPQRRGATMAISNQSGTVGSLLSTKLSVIKEISSVNKSISELEIKKQDRDLKIQALEKDANPESNEHLIDDIIERMMDTNVDITESVDAEHSKRKGKKKEMTEEYLDEMVSDLIENDEDFLNENQKAIRYENMGVEFVVVSKLNTHHWHLMAIDNEGDELVDYPVPDKKVISPMSIDYEMLTAEDSLGKTYRVFLE